MNIEKHKGDKMNPCGTPDLRPSASTTIVRSSRKEVMSEPVRRLLKVKKVSKFMDEK
jgi:hypothetical protein